MRSSTVRMLITNLVLLWLIVVPVWYVVATLQGRLTAPLGHESLSVGGAVFLSIVYVPYMLPGWATQQIVLVGAQDRLARPFGRLLAIASAALLAASLVLLHPEITRSPDVWPSAFAGLFVYGAVCRNGARAKQSAKFKTAETDDGA